MLQLIVFIIFIASLVGVLFILLKNIPALIQLPQNGTSGFQKNEFVTNIEKKIKDIYFHFFEKQMLLHKILSKFRLLTLKAERKIDESLSVIRKKAQELDQQARKRKQKPKN
ncbi:MAG: hypothetical protein EXS52_02480 [Candidatus Staskawiczbacteria bacterium]|nr:hypothetical protein [Candidatus Staskawiczbacteria bacterium]